MPPVNLACAAGLPGAEDLDVPHCLAVLDAWAGHGGRETERCAGQFQAEPAAFADSWAHFRVLGSKPSPNWTAVARP